MRFLALWLLAICWSPPVSAQSGTGPFGARYTVSTLAPGVYTLIWEMTAGLPVIGNSTFIVGDRDVIVIDSGLSKVAGEAIIAGLRQVSDKPVLLVVNTHWHGDHVFGNQAFRTAFPGARFASHVETRGAIIARDLAYRDDTG